jgi:hypothetical protein
MDFIEFLKILGLGVAPVVAWAAIVAVLICWAFDNSIWLGIIICSLVVLSLYPVVLYVTYISTILSI